MSKGEAIERICFVGFSKSNTWKQLRLLLRTQGLCQKVGSHPANCSLAVYANGTVYLVQQNTPNSDGQQEILVRQQLKNWNSSSYEGFDDEVCPTIGKLLSKGQSKLKALAAYLALWPQQASFMNLQELCGWQAHLSKFINVRNSNELHQATIWSHLSACMQKSSNQILTSIQQKMQQNPDIDLITDGIREICHFKIAAFQSFDQVKTLQDDLRKMYNKFGLGECLGLQSNSDQSLDLWLIRDRQTKKMEPNEKSAILVLKHLPQVSQEQISTSTTRRVS